MEFKRNPGTLGMHGRRGAIGATGHLPGKAPGPKRRAEAALDNAGGYSHGRGYALPLTPAWRLNASGRRRAHLRVRLPLTSPDRYQGSDPQAPRYG